MRVVIIVLLMLVLCLATQVQVIHADITQEKTECGLIDCWSIFSIDKDLSAKSSIGMVYPVKDNQFPLGQFLNHTVNKISGVSIEIVDKNHIKVSGKIKPMTQNLWGFSFDGDTSELHSVWWNSSYNYKMNISCTHMDDGVPLVVNGSSGFSISGHNQIVWTYCSGDGTAVYYNSYTDYLIANETDRLPFEVESGDVASYNPTTVWSDYLLVLHLSETSGNATDSTGNSLGMAISGTPTRNINGMIGKAYNFSKANGDYLSMADLGISGNQAYTVEMWALLYGYGTSTDRRTYFSMGSYSNYATATIEIRNDATYNRTQWVDYGSDVSYTKQGLNAWTLVTAIYDGVNTNVAHRDLFYNMENPAVVSDDSNTNALNLPSPCPLRISERVSGGSYHWQGILDEIRIASADFTTARANQTYQNAIGTDGYGTLGIKESLDKTFSIAFADPTPVNYAEIGFNYNPVINTTISLSTYVTTNNITIEWGGTNITLTDLTTYAQYIPSVSGGTQYNYVVYLNTDAGINHTERRYLNISTFSVSEMGSRFTTEDLVLILLLVLVGIIVYALIRMK